MASVCVFGHSEAIRGAFSCLKPSCDCLSLAPVNYLGSMQVQGQSEILRLSGGGSAPSPPHPAPSVGVATVFANNDLCNVWCFGGSLCVSVSLSPGFFLINIPYTSPCFSFSLMFCSNRTLILLNRLFKLNFPAAWSYKVLDGRGVFSFTHVLFLFWQM